MALELKQLSIITKPLGGQSCWFLHKKCINSSGAYGDLGTVSHLDEKDTKPICLKKECFLCWQFF
jgi:hypothetical protein